MSFLNEWHAVLKKKSILVVMSENLEDITERKRAEEEVIEAQDKLQLQEKLPMLNWVAESSIIAIITTDLEGMLNYVNPVCLKMWGYQKAEEVLGRYGPGFWLFPSDLIKAADECRAKGEWTGELVARRKDGTLFNAFSVDEFDQGQ